MGLTPLEVLYPWRCFDCLAEITTDAVLCAACAAVYSRGGDAIAD